MANFSFWMAQHTILGQRSLEDVIQIVIHQLRELGHTAVWDPANREFLLPNMPFNVSGRSVAPSPDTYNVLVEGFTPEIAQLIGHFHVQGARFVCLATEEPSDQGFNHGTTPEMAARGRDFVAAAPYLSAIWHLVPGQHVTDWYARHAPSAHVELGYAASLVRRETAAQLRGTFNPAPRFDFGFYGSLSRRRHALLKRLHASTGKTIKLVHDFKSGPERDAAMMEAKVILQIRKFEEMGLVSSSRCNRALCIGRPVVAEPHELSRPWDEVVSFGKTEDDFFARAVAMLSTWRSSHAHQFDRFREKFTPEYCVGRALQATLGISRGEARGASARAADAAAARAARRAILRRYGAAA